LVDQFRSDREVKFRQVELQNLLVDLFVDVPVAAPATRTERLGAAAIAAFVYSRVAQASVARREAQPHDDPAYREERSAVGAATLLLHPFFQEHVPRMVLEGAPGQGKSTIGQYVCQAHRARLLSDDEQLAKIPVEHRTGPVRLPFRIDLRDLATWLAR